jgi:hypothetical protein
LSVSGYDGAIMSLGLMVRFDELLFEGRPASIFPFNNFHTEIDWNPIGRLQVLREAEPSAKSREV